MGGGKGSDQRLGRGRRTAQCIHHRRQPISDAGLAQVAEPGAKPDHGLRVEAGEQHQLVEGIILGIAGEHLGNRLLDHRHSGEDLVDIAAFRELKQEVVDVSDLAAAHRGRQFLEYAEAEILQHRDRFRQRDEPAQSIGLEVKLVGRGMFAAIEPRVAVMFIVELANPQDVGCRVERLGARAIAFGHRRQIG